MHRFSLWIALCLCLMGCTPTSALDAGAGLDAPGDAPVATDSPSTDAPEASDAPSDVPDDTTSSDAPSMTDAGVRTVVTESCARTYGACNADADCMLGGCGGEMCTSEDVATTCDCLAVAGSCGCVDGMCAWYR